ncbi:MAG: hypothetical protein ABSB25_04265 [Sedimentisphaerales bacterium]|jgi:hypothetical protein
MAICGLVSAFLFFLKKRHRNKWEKWKEVTMKVAFLLLVISFLTATFLAPYLLHREREVAIINTKHDIRTFLESINPVILQKIDTGQKEIHVLISIPKQMKLSDLSERSDFSKFLSFKRSGDVSLGGGQINGFINELNQNGAMDGYYLYPKDALVK